LDLAIVNLGAVLETLLRIRILDRVVGRERLAAVDSLLASGGIDRIVDRAGALTLAGASPGSAGLITARRLIATLALALALSLTLTILVAAVSAGLLALSLALALSLTLSLPLALLLAARLLALALLPILLGPLALLLALTTCLLTLALLRRATDLRTALLHLGQGALALTAGP
jgi:hypothetical protein